jgi:hypothetical protein
MGKTENTTEPETLKKQTLVLDLHATGLARTAKAIGKQAKLLTLAADDGMAIADAAVEHSGACKAAGAASDEFVDVCESLAEFHVGLEDLRLTLSSQTSDVADALRALTKAEIRHAKNVKGKYDKVRLTYEAQTAKVKKLREQQKNVKADEAQKQIDEELRDKFDATGRDATDVLETANLAAENETVEQIANYLEAYADFAAKCHAWLQGSAPLIERSRAFVERRRVELQGREAAAIALAKKGRVFGEQLTVLVDKEGAPIPKVVSALIDYLVKNALAEEGIFRVTGFKSEMATLRQRAEADDNFSLDGQPNLAHEVASLLKLFLRELPDPLFTFQLYEQFIALVDQPLAEREKRFHELFAQMPPAHQALARALMKLMYTVAANSSENKMTPSNLSIVMSPNVFVANHGDPMRMVKESASASAVFEWMVVHYGQLYGDASAPVMVKKAADAAAAAPARGAAARHDLDELDLDD